MIVAGNPARSQAQNFKGFIPLPRTFFDHPLWQKKRVLAPAEALLYLYRLARCLPTETLKRGEFQRSEQEMATDWGWTRSRVHRFMAARQAEGLIGITYARDGEVPVYAISEIAKTPTKPANVQGSAPAPEPVKPAPVVNAAPVIEPVVETKSDTPPQKKERTKERKVLEFRDVKNRESEEFPNTEQAARSEIPAVSPPVSIQVLKTEIQKTETPPSPEQRQKWTQELARYVAPEAYQLKIPLSRMQCLGIRNAINAGFLPWPRAGSWLAVQLRRPI